VPVGDVENHLRAGRLERASELLAGHEGEVAERLRGRIAARATERSLALAALEVLVAGREDRDPDEVLTDLRATISATRDPVVREQAEIALSSAHDWAANLRAANPVAGTPRGAATRATEDAGARQRSGQDVDPIAAAAMREFEVAVQAKEWSRALGLADRWATAESVDRAVRDAFATWRRAAYADALAESDALVVRAWRHEQDGEHERAVALLSGALERFPRGDASIGVGRVLAELRGSSGKGSSGAGSTGERLAAGSERPSASAPTTPSSLIHTDRVVDTGATRAADARPGVDAGPIEAELADLRVARENERLERKAVFEGPGRRLRDASTAVERDAAYAELRGAARDNVLAQEVLAEALHGRFDDVIAQLESAGPYRKLERVAEHRRELDRAREAALALIFDEERYFYPYTEPKVSGVKAATYPAVQREVDRLVERVAEVWESSPKARLPEPLAKVLVELTWLRRRAWHVDDRLPLPASLPSWLEGLPHDQGEVTVANFGWSLDEARQLARDRAVAVRNDSAWASSDDSKASPSRNGTQGAAVAPPSRVERDQVLLTNAYRALMGRSALAWHGSLHSAARGHSEYMNTTGLFGHDEVHAATRTPFDRMCAVGYVRGISENCHKGSGDAEGPHRGWMRSSGHHRNLLSTGHKEMASGVAGGYWTQNFGLDTAFEAHLDLGAWRD